MRKTIAIMLAAAALVGLGAQPAAADDPDAQVSSSSSWFYQSQECWTPYRHGVYGQYGAWGNYVDGCTVGLRCESPACYVDEAIATLSVNPSDMTYANNQLTCNVRLRIFGPSWNLRFQRDASGTASGTYGRQCKANVGRGFQALRGDIVTLQGNGVRSNWSGSAQMRVSLRFP